MTRDSSPVPEDAAKPGSPMTEDIAVLLTAIEKEEVPDRLLQLAQALQKALNEKLSAEQ